MVGVVYDSMGGNPFVRGHEQAISNFMGVSSDVTIEWSYGVTTKQQDPWSCGYRVMHGMAAYLQAMTAIGTTTSRQA